MSFGREIEKINFSKKYCQCEHAPWSLWSSVLTHAHLLPGLSCHCPFPYSQSSMSCIHTSQSPQFLISKENWICWVTNTGQKGEEPKGIGPSGRISWHLGEGEMSPRPSSRSVASSLTREGKSVSQRAPSTLTFISLVCFRPYVLHSVFYSASKSTLQGF